MPEGFAWGKNKSPLCGLKKLEQLNFTTKNQLPERAYAER